LVATEIFSRGIDIEKINIVFNFDMPDNSDSYLHRVGRAGRFGTKGLAISFVESDEDKKVLEDVQKRFEVKIGELPTTIDSASYSKSNPTTNIVYAVPVKSNVTLDVYNLIGQKVVTLFEGDVEAGKHSSQFNASSMSSGMYLFKLTAVGEDGSQFSSSKKMTLLK